VPDAPWKSCDDAPLLIWLANDVTIDRLLAFDQTNRVCIGVEREGGSTFRRAVRVALRLALACREDGAGSARNPFRIAPAGKPHSDNSAIQFSVAHCRDAALIAIDRSSSLGVDLEALRSISMPVERQAAIMEAASRHGLLNASAASEGHDGLPLDDQAFLRAWTRIEALAKARGDGLGGILADLGIRAQLAASPGAARPTPAGVLQGFVLHDLSVPAPWIAAVAWLRDESPPVPIPFAHLIDDAMRNWIAQMS
jgi:phosphopantetheinyl transferase